MNLIKVYEIITTEIKKNYSTKTEVAKAMNIRKQLLNEMLYRLKNNKGITFQRLERILNFLGYEIIIKKKRTN